ncbi:hypothetical protein AB0K02_00985 [Streptomyces sp. NPDC049597]|uniref:hypothetical protein n=1 Tax=Streptomyces sp. NPDC049597 TaxID=3155276 RepID=UPI003432EABA
MQSQISRRGAQRHAAAGGLERTRAAEPPRPLRFAAGDLAARAEEGSRPLVRLRDVRVPGRLALDGLEVSVTERLLVTGRNGAGRSALLAVLAGRLPVEGEVRRRHGMTVGCSPRTPCSSGADRMVRDTYRMSLGAERAEKAPLRSLGLLHEADLAHRSDGCP